MITFIDGSFRFINRFIENTIDQLDKNYSLFYFNISPPNTEFYFLLLAFFTVENTKTASETKSIIPQCPYYHIRQPHRKNISSYQK